MYSTSLKSISHVMTSKLVALSKLSGKVLVPFYSSKKSTHRGTPILTEAIEVLV
jgi:hypothetical protein